MYSIVVSGSDKFSSEARQTGAGDVHPRQDFVVGAGLAVFAELYRRAALAAVGFPGVLADGNALTGRATVAVFRADGDGQGCFPSVVGGGHL